jgi:hypothetical protein
MDMALTDIVFTTGEQIGFVQYVNRGDIGTVSEVLSETDSSFGVLLNEIPQVTGGSVSEFSYIFVS